jgi:membrane protein DedA with SNARE-associated domain
MQFVEDLLPLIDKYVAAYGALAIFVVVYFESFGAPLPGETGVIATALLAARGDISIVAVFFAVFAGAVLGDTTGYLIGRVGGRRLLVRYGPYVKLTPKRLAAIEAQMPYKGFYLVMIARFLPVLRQLNGLIAGSVNMPWHRFIVAQMIGALLWTSVYGLGPYFFTEFFHRAVR